MDIAAWLRELGLERYETAFRSNDIDVDLLSDLTEGDLERLGVASLGHRKKLRRAIEALRPPEPLGHSTPALRSEAERRQLTVMFVDLVGSTALSARLDPEEMREVIRGYQNAVAGEIARFDGYVAKFMGDGVLAYFGWPRAHEEDAERAVRAGLAVMQAMAAIATREGQSLAARAGIATGLVVVGDLIGEGAAQEEAVVGETPNLAARLQGLAEPGQVVIAESTRRLLGDLFELTNLGPKQVKGMAGPVPVFAILRERSVESRFEARSGPSLLPMVGRDHELALLLERWAQAKVGEGQGVLLIGEAGIGKSRISRALMDALAAEPHTRIRYQCSPYHTDSALWPVIRQLSHAADFVSDDPTEVRLAKLEKLLAQAGGGARRAAPLIADLIGLDYESRYGALELSPQARRSRTLEVLVEQLLGLAARQPVLVVLEDAHWVDPSTQEMIEQGLDRIGSERVMILLTSRPDHQPELAAHPHVTRLTLNRLGRNGVEAIVARLGGEDLPPATVDAIIARADGVPLFVEELTKAILETGETTIPASLHDSLMARLDRIPDVKEIAQIAACIGREFSYPLLDAVAARAEPEPRASLDKLAAAQIVFRRGIPPEAHYTFKHALVRDAAYQSLLKTKRQELHARIAEVLESRFPDAVELQPELVGHHHAEAGHAEAAVRYWRLAAERALRASASLEAVRHYERALEQLATLPETPDRDRDEIDLQLGLGAALIAPKSYAAEEVRAAFARAEVLCRAAADTARHFRALRGLWNWHLLRADVAEAARLADRLLSLAERSVEPAHRLMAYRISGTTCNGLGRYRSARAHFDKGLQLYDPKDQNSYVLLYGEDPGLICYLYSAQCDEIMGYRDQALRQLELGVNAARDLPNRYTLAFVLSLSSFVYMSRREIENTRRCAEEAFMVARQQGVAQWWAQASVYHGWALAKAGDVEAGLHQAREGLNRTEFCRRLVGLSLYAATARFSRSA